MTTKQRPEVQENPHGFYECFIANGSLQQKQSVGTTTTPQRTVEWCSFTPPQGLAFVIIYAMQDRNHIYKSIEPQFNSPIDTISSAAALANFHTQLGNPEDNNLRADDLGHYLELTYPLSGLKDVIGAESYNGPALFIAW